MSGRCTAWVFSLSGDAVRFREKPAGAEWPAGRLVRGSVLRQEGGLQAARRAGKTLFLGVTGRARQEEVSL